MMMSSLNTPRFTAPHNYFDVPDQACAATAAAGTATGTHNHSSANEAPRAGVLAQNGYMGFYRVCPPNEGPALSATESDPCAPLSLLPYDADGNDSGITAPVPRLFKQAQEMPPQPQSSPGKTRNKPSLHVACPPQPGLGLAAPAPTDVSNAADMPPPPSQPPAQQSDKSKRGVQRDFFDVMDCDTGALTFVPPQNAKTMAIMGSISLKSMPEHARSDYPIREFTVCPPTVAATASKKSVRQHGTRHTTNSYLGRKSICCT